MSRSTESTMLQRMGFLDHDRKLPEHDRACIELATDPAALARALGIDFDSAAAKLECPLQKGDGKYATTVGFIDALVTSYKHLTSRYCDTEIGHRYHGVTVPCASCVEEELRHVSALMLVEVKTKIENIGDLLRQMNLYREYFKATHYVVWSLRSADAQFRVLLGSQGIVLVAGASLVAIGSDR
jgi:hypothetical protein